MNRCLFLDDWHIAKMDCLQRRGHPAKRYPGNPLIVKQFPWEAARIQVYGRCVVYNEEQKLFQMFYLAMPGCEHYPNVRVGGDTKVGHVTLPAYAESKDGIHWERPLRPDVPFEDIAETNLLDLHRGQSFEAGVLWDPRDPDPARRYKAFVWDQEFEMPLPGKMDWARTEQGTVLRILDDDGKVIFEQPWAMPGIRVAFSPDAIHWANQPGWAFHCSSDTGNSVLYDPTIGKYVAFGRFSGTPTKRFSVGRAVSRVESEDFIHWSQPELVLTADDQDPESFQINSMPVDIYEGVYIGLIEPDVRPLPHPARPPQLATSRDGRYWTRAAGRFPIIEKPDEGAWDYCGGMGWVRPGTSLVVRDDEVWMYYSAGPSEMYEDSESAADWFLGVGLAKWRRDGFISLHADERGGELLTKAFVADGPDVHLNIDCARGEATVRICDHQGVPMPGLKVSEPSEPIRVNHIDTVVRWPENDLAEKRLGKPITLRMRMANADLYSFWTV